MQREKNSFEPHEPLFYPPLRRHGSDTSFGHRICGREGRLARRDYWVDTSGLLVGGGKAGESEQREDLKSYDLIRTYD